MSTLLHHCYNNCNSYFLHLKYSFVTIFSIYLLVTHKRIVGCLNLCTTVKLGYSKATLLLASNQKIIIYFLKSFKRFQFQISFKWPLQKVAALKLAAQKVLSPFIIVPRLYYIWSVTDNRQIHLQWNTGWLIHLHWCKIYINGTKTIIWFMIHEHWSWRHVWKSGWKGSCAKSALLA